MKKTLLTCSLMLFSAMPYAIDTSVLKAAVMKDVEAHIHTPEIIAAIKAQNAEHATLDEAAILELDQQWRAERKADEKPLISKVLSNSVSAKLSTLKEDSTGAYNEIFVMDNKGLNVGQSDVTSDYWQGDEAKFQQSYGTNSVHVGDVDLDESSQAVGVQISSVVKDPDTGEKIGAVTFGVNFQ